MNTPETTAYAAVPQGLEFINIQLDGIYMGWQGNLQDSVFEFIRSLRYGDLEDANGNNVGGIGKWFPPPHLFYINTHAADPGLDNIDLQLSNVTDSGPRIGVARDTNSDNLSGYANSLKLGCTDCSVTNYTSLRPDGFMDVLPASNLTVNGVTGTFDSAFLNNLYPAALRFPETGYSGVTFENVSLHDSAAATLQGPISNATSSSNAALAFANFTIDMSRWSGPNLPLPAIAGTSNDIDLNFNMSQQLMKVAYLQTGALGLTVTGKPTTVNAGAATAIDWSAVNATDCIANGAWVGSIGTGGTRSVTLPSAGNYAFTLTCQNSADSAATTLDAVAL
jgi:hypothetical protein